MKKTFALSLLVPLALVCSCQKQDSTAEQELTKRKTELDAREKALDDKEKALEQREQVIAKTRVPSVPRIAPVPSPAQPRQTVPPEMQGLVADPSQGRAEREQRLQERLIERQRKIEEVQRRRVRVSRPIQATAPSTQEAASPIPSPTPE
jgi:hypothetical protein